MKLKENFTLEKLAGNYVVLPLDKSTVDFNGMLALNETGAFLWEKLEQGKTKEELCELICKEYDVSIETATADIDEFIKKLADAGCIEL